MKQKQHNNSLILKIEKYLSIYTIYLKETLLYPAKLRTTAILVPFRIIILLVIYNYTFSYIGKTINGINANIAIWSIAIYHVLLFLQFRGIFKTINDEIRRGNFEVQLNKPYNYLIYKFWEHLGKGVPNLVISLITVTPLLFLLTHGIPSSINYSSIIGEVLLVIGGTIVSAGLYILISLPVFWIDDATPFYWIVDKGILILGGAYVPLALLPQLFHKIANVTPFGAPMFATQIFNPNFSSIWFLLLLNQIIWIIILFLLISFFYNQAQKKLSVNGG